MAKKVARRTAKKKTAKKSIEVVTRGKGGYHTIDGKKMSPEMKAACKLIDLCGSVEEAKALLSAFKDIPAKKK